MGVLKRYGLQSISTGELIGFESETITVEFGYAMEYRLEMDCGNIWLVENRADAEQALKEDPEWHKCTYTVPCVGHSRMDLRVVEITLGVEPV